jgi:MFS family permease
VAAEAGPLIQVMSSGESGVVWRDLTFTILVPNALLGAGQGALAPTIPIAAIQMGASYSLAALIAAMLTVGVLVSTLPAGWLVARVPEKWAMFSAGLASMLAAITAFLAPNLVVLVLAVIVMGAGTSVFAMGRHTWVTTSTPAATRGRVISTMAGMYRLGVMVGPFLAALSFALTHDATSAFAAVAITSAGICIVVTAARFPPASPKPEGQAPPSAFSTMWKHRRVLTRVGALISVLATMREARRVVLPLVGVAVGLTEVRVALVIGVASAVDFSLFYVGGSMTDRLGRLWVAIPALIAFGVSFLLVAFVDLLPGSATWYMAAAFVMSVGNGISAGIIGTVGSDLAQSRGPAAFLSSWRVITDAGAAAAPLGIAGMTAVASVGAACVVLAVTALSTAWLLPRHLRRWLPPDVR